MEQNKIGNFYIFIMNNSHNFIPQISKVVIPLGKQIFLVPWDLKYNRITIIRPQNSSFTHLVLFDDT